MHAHTWLVVTTQGVGWYYQRYALCPSVAMDTLIYHYSGARQQYL